MYPSGRTVTWRKEQFPRALVVTLAGCSARTLASSYPESGWGCGLLPALFLNSWVIWTTDSWSSDGQSSARPPVGTVREPGDCCSSNIPNTKTTWGKLYPLAWPAGSIQEGPLP